MTAPMPARTLKALKGSIEKWEKIVAGTGEDRGEKNCPLCQLFIRSAAAACAGCPVNEVSGDGCENTPYAPWRDALADNRKAVTPLQKWLARAELRFLKSLLPSVPVRKATRRAVAGKPVPRRSRA